MKGHCIVCLGILPCQYGHDQLTPDQKRRESLPDAKPVARATEQKPAKPPKS